MVGQRSFSCLSDADWVVRNTGGIVDSEFNSEVHQLKDLEITLRPVLAVNGRPAGNVTVQVAGHNVLGRHR